MYLFCSDPQMCALYSIPKSIWFFDHFFPFSTLHRATDGKNNKTTSASSTRWLAFPKPPEVEGGEMDQSWRITPSCHSPPPNTARRVMVHSFSRSQETRHYSYDIVSDRSKFRIPVSWPPLVHSSFSLLLLASPGSPGKSFFASLLVRLLLR